MHIVRNLIQRCVLGVTVVAGAAAMNGGTALAAQTLPTSPSLSGTVLFRIDAQSVNDALKQFASQANVQLVYESQDVDPAIRTEGLTGSFTPEEALTRLLAHTNLQYRFLNTHTVSIRYAQASASPPAASSANTPIMRVATADPDSQRGELQEIVITAQRREERLADVPQSVAVVSSADLAKLGAVQFSDFANTVPGLSLQTGGVGFDSISLRGVTTGNDASPTVGIYVDEVPYGSSTPFALAGRAGFEAALFDQDRVEILRGPQGTLYGASSIGGVIKYVTKLPSTTDFGGDAQANVSDIGDGGGITYSAAGAVNMPFIPTKAAGRLSAYYSHNGGYIDNVETASRNVNRSYVDGARADFLLTPTDALSVRITGFAQNISRGGESTADYTFAGDPIAGELDQFRGFNEAFKQRFRLASGTVKYEFGPVEITSVSSYQTSRTNWLADTSSEFVPLLKGVGLDYSAVGDAVLLSTNKFTQEVRLASAGTNHVDWVIGGFYTHETAEDNEHFLLNDLQGAPAPNGLYTYDLPTKYSEYALFGDLTWQVTDKIDVTGGGRWAHNKQSFQQFGTGAFGATSDPFSSSEGVFTYLANARYHIAKDTMAYLRYATGYRPGGPAIVVALNPTAPNHFDPDRLRSYEAGFRSEFMDRRLSADVAVYAIDWSDMQTPTATSGFSTYTNAKVPAHIQGTELTLTAHPVNAFTWSGSFAYQHAYMTDADENLGAAAGERLPNVPRIMASSNADYQIVPNGLRPTIGATVRYVSDRFASFDQSTSYPQYHLPSYTAVDLRAGLTVNSIGIQLYIHNIGDERGQLSAITKFQKPQVAIMQPRTVGISVDTQF